MQKVLALLLLIIFYSLSALADEPAPRACTIPPTPYDKPFIGLKAVGLAFSTNGEGSSLPEPLEADHLVTLLSNRIRKQLLPYVSPNSDCQVPDLTVFRTDGARVYKDGYSLGDFIAEDGTLTVSVNLKVFSDGQKPQIAVLRWFYFRHNFSPTVTPFGDVSGGDMIVLPTDLPPEVLDRRIDDAFTTFTFVQTRASKTYRNLVPQDNLSPEQAKQMEEAGRNKARESKEPVTMVPLPPAPLRPGAD